MVDYKRLLCHAALYATLVVGPINCASLQQQGTEKPSQPAQSESMFSDITFCTMDHIVDYVKKQAEVAAEHYVSTAVEKYSLDVDEEALERRVQEQIEESDDWVKYCIKSEYADTSWVHALERNQRLKERVQSIEQYVSGLEADDMQNPYFPRENPGQAREHKKEIFEQLLEYRKQEYIDRAGDNNSIVCDYLDGLTALGHALGEVLTREVLSGESPQFEDTYKSHK